jgi:hypothetical protein
MFFQIFKELVFSNGELQPSAITEELTHTWASHALLIDRPVEYAHVMAGGKSLSECCPEHLKDEWKEITGKMKAIQKSFQITGIDVSNVDPRHFIPENFILKYLTIKNLICEDVFQTHEKPKNYDFMTELLDFCCEIAKKPLKINLETIKYTHQHLDTFRKLNRASYHVQYDAYKAITGRLSTKPGSFPILNLKKDCRGVIEPYNDCFVELDFNAAELRTFLALNDKEQPENDIHEWNAKHVFMKEDLDRAEIKKKTFSWLYDPKSVNKSLEMCYNKKYVLEKYFNGEYVSTIFDRKIKADDHHALNYVIQSTTSDLFMKQAIKIWKLLKGKKTNVAFTIHDSLVLDFSLSDKGMVEDIVKLFSNTELGTFKVNLSGGKNFGKMKEMNL